MKVVYIVGKAYIGSTEEEIQMERQYLGEKMKKVADAGAVPWCPSWDMMGIYGGKKKAPLGLYTEVMERCDAVLLPQEGRLSERYLHVREMALVRVAPVFFTMAQLVRWLRLGDAWPPEVYKEIDDHERGYESPLYPGEAWLECEVHSVTSRGEGYIEVAVHARGGEYYYYAIEEEEVYYSKPGARPFRSLVGSMVRIKVRILSQYHSSTLVEVEEKGGRYRVEVDPSMLIACTD